MSDYRYSCPACGAATYSDTRICSNCGHDMSDPFLRPAHDISESEPPGNRPRNYYGMAMLAMFLFPPMGLVALIHAAKVDQRFDSGDQYGAETASRDAKKWARLSLIFTAVSWVFMIGMILVYAMMHNPPGH